MGTPFSGLLACAFECANGIVWTSRLSFSMCAAASAELLCWYIACICNKAVTSHCGRATVMVYLIPSGARLQNRMAEAVVCFAGLPSPRPSSSMVHGVSCLYTRHPSAVHSILAALEPASNANTPAGARPFDGLHWLSGTVWTSRGAAKSQLVLEFS